MLVLSSELFLTVCFGVLLAHLFLADFLAREMLKSPLLSPCVVLFTYDIRACSIQSLTHDSDTRLSIA